MRRNHLLKFIFLIPLGYSAICIACALPEPQSCVAGRTCTVPLYKQTDSSWANTPYGYKDVQATKKATIATSACGPTSAAMVLSYWKGQYITPKMTSEYCLKNGYRKNGYGTDEKCYTALAKKYNLKIKKVSASEAKNALKGYVVGGVTYKKPIIMTVNSCQKKKYTAEGHFIVLTRIVGDTVYINDPNKNNTSDSASNIFGSCKKNGFWMIYK